MTQRRILPSLMTALVFAAAATSFPVGGQAAEYDREYHHKPRHVGEVTIKTKRVSVGIGFTWGEGTLRFRGKDYNFKVNGLNMIGLGFATMIARGEVYNLESLADFPGKYYGVEGGATLVEGSAGLVIKNSQGVVMNLKAEQKGVDLRLGDQGLSITPAWQ
jgi:hypothetical protein